MREREKKKEREREREEKKKKESDIRKRNFTFPSSRRGSNLSQASLKNVPRISVPKGIVECSRKKTLVSVIILHHITSHHITSHDMTSHDITSHLIT